MFCKRMADIVVSLVFLCTLFPFIYIIVGIAIKISSPGPILFRQPRHGLNGTVFTCLKFRTMYVRATPGPVELDERYRITSVGNFLRNTHIDEFPQFINVLRGDMSLIGPRPHTLDDTERFSAMCPGYDYMHRHAMRPGVTGLAQVLGYKGRVKTDRDAIGRVRLDLWYVDHYSFGLDVRIFMQTFVNQIRSIIKLSKLSLTK